MNRLDLPPRAWCGRVCLVFFVVGWLVAGLPNQWISPPSLFVVASLLALGAGGCADDRWRLRFFSGWPILLLAVSSPLWLLLSAVVQPTSLWNWCGGDRQPAVALRAWGETLPAWFLAWSFGWCLAMRDHPAMRARLGRLLAKWAVPLTLAAMAITFSLHVGWGVAGPMIVDQHAYSAPFASAAAQSDAQQYELGSYVLAETGVMPEWNQRRPINTAWTVVRMGVSGMDPVATMWLGAIFLGLTAGLLIREVALALGFASGLMVWVFCWGMARFFLATQLSEVFGLALGAWGAAWMVRGWSRGSAAYGLLGLFVLTLGQAARPGALFVLPLLGLAGAIVRVKGESRGWRRVNIIVPLAVSAGVVLAGLSLNPVLNQRYGTGANFTGSNFALTIAGLASGTSWDAVEVEFADELAAMPDEATRSRWLYQVGWQRFLEQPSLFFGKAVKGFYLFAMESPLALSVSLFRARLAGAWLAMLSLAVGWCVLGMLMLRRLASSSDSWRLAALALFIGMGLSVPFVYLDGSIRVFVATWPLVFVMLAMGVAEPAATTASLPAGQDIKMGQRGSRWINYLEASCLVLLLVVLILGPAAIHTLQARQSHAKQSLGAVAVAKSKRPGRERVIIWYQGPRIEFSRPGREGLATEQAYGLDDFRRAIEIGRLPCREPLLVALSNQPTAFQTIVDSRSWQQWYVFHTGDAAVGRGQQLELEVLSTTPPIGVVAELESIQAD